MKMSELIEYLIMVEKDESIDDLEIRCTDHSRNIDMYPNQVILVTMAGNSKKYFSLEVM
jgi:hypothetical protein